MANDIQLEWDKFTKTILPDKRTKIGLFRSTASYKSSSLFISLNNNTPTPVCFRAQKRVHDNYSGQEEEKTINAAQQQSSKKVSFAPEFEKHQQFKLRYTQGNLNQSPDATEILREDASN